MNAKKRFLFHFYIPIYSFTKCLMLTSCDFFQDKRFFNKRRGKEEKEDYLG